MLKKLNKIKKDVKREVSDFFKYTKRNAKKREAILKKMQEERLKKNKK